MLELQHISKWVNTGSNRTFILKDINLTVKQGEFVSIMGPSGSGKSSLLNIIGMLDEPSEGEYFFMGEAVHKLKEKTSFCFVQAIYRLCFPGLSSDR